MIRPVKNKYGRSGGGGGGSPVPGDGMFKELLQQPGNRSTECKVRVAGFPFGKANWSDSATYAFGDQRVYPIATISEPANSPSPLMYIVVDPAGVGAGEAPPPDNPKWELANGVSFLQKAPESLGANKWFHYGMQRNGDGYIRLGDISIGEIVRKRHFVANDNYEVETPTSTTSSTSNSVATTHPSSRTWAAGIGLTIPNSASLGTSNNTSYAMPSVQAFISDFVLPTGLTLNPGEYVTCEGDANNFFVLQVLRYDSSTGLNYSYVYAVVGTGTFTTWTIKKEELWSAYQTGGEGTRNMTGLIQSYNSGTGELIMKTIAHIGSGSTSSWTLRTVQNRPSSVPVDSQGNSFHSTTNGAIGAWFRIVSENTSVSVRYQTDNRGTKWVAVYVGGPRLSNPPANVEFDTYSASLNSGGLVGTLYDDFEKDEHEWIFIAVNSNNGSSANTRSWIKAGTGSGITSTTAEYRNFDEHVRDYDLTHVGAQSVGEFVWIYGEPGEVTDVATAPFHGNRISHSETRVVKVDGVSIDLTSTDENDNPYLYDYLPCTKVEIEQTGILINYYDLAGGDYATYTSKHVLDRNGFYVDPSSQIETLVPQRISQGYANMYATFDSWSIPGRITADGGVFMEYDPGDENQIPMIAGFEYKQSYIHQSFVSGREDVVVGDFIEDMDIWREGQPGEYIHHIQNNTGNTCKFRLYSIRDLEVGAGFIFKFGGDRKYIGFKGDMLP